MRKFFKIATKVILTIAVLVCLGIAYIKLALPNIEVDETVTIKQTTERVARGKYLANHVAVCMDCHSKRDWSSFAGPMSASGIGGGGEKFDREMGFPGVFYAPNITPYSLAKWTDGELLRAITSGVSKDGKALFPLMNYHRFGQMGKEDIYSIIAYIRTLKTVKNDVPASEADFPVSILINTFPSEAQYQPIPSKQDAKLYGKYLANASGCVDCHSKTDKGNIIAGTEFGGGMVFQQPGGSVTSPNLTPDPETGIGNWTEQSFIQRFSIFSSPGYTPAKLATDQLNTPMPWNMYAGMKKEDLSAIYAYLKTLDPIKNKVIIYKKK